MTVSSISSFFILRGSHDSIAFIVPLNELTLTRKRETDNTCRTEGRNPYGLIVTRKKQSSLKKTATVKEKAAANLVSP